MLTNKQIQQMIDLWYKGWRNHCPDNLLLLAIADAVLENNCAPLFWDDSQFRECVNIIMTSYDGIELRDAYCSITHNLNGLWSNLCKADC